MKMLILPVAFVAVIIAWFVATYNGLVKLRNQVKNAWSQIDVQLKRRHDLIPNLIETVKGYMDHEKETLELVTKARYAATEAQGPKAQSAAESKLSGALGKLMLVVENYPDLKANQNFLAVQEELVSTENKVGFARQLYNDTAMKMNTKIESVPANLVAGMFQFTQSEYFEIEDSRDRAVPQVSFDDKNDDPNS